ncbi:MAG: S8 family serine peptidase [Bdellovibrionales bacterium]|nr:S8 family serine peptidase [Bdellovibrionales bacterium]
MKQKMKRPLQAMLIVFSIGTISGSLITETIAEKKEPELKLSDLASTAPSGRTLELGKAIPTDKNLKKEVQVLMKDPAMSEKWGLKLTDSKRAWRVSQGSKDIVVAVIDTGADMHTDLINNLWRNSGETGKDIRGNDKSTNGIDDDKNGYIDDVHGFNFVGNNHDLSDNHGHGTHIAGIIGAEGGNGVGISGVAPKVSLMILKYYDPKAPGINNLMNTVKAIDYAVRNGAHIINYSGGGLEPSPQEKAAIARAEKRGILVVAAAGNEQSDSDVHGYYPADYELTNIISVTAINKSRKVLDSSNWGLNSVDLAAPGHNIYSLLPGNQYGFMTGTSQATAFVSGVAALVMAQDPELRSAEKIHKYLTQTGDIDMNLLGKTRYTKRLNSYKALTIKDSDSSWNGTRAENAVNIKASTFASNPGLALSGIGSETTGSPEGHFASQTRNILKHLVDEKSVKNAIDSPTNTEVGAPPQL